MGWNHQRELLCNMLALAQNYGFIAPDTGGPDIFVHKRNVRRDAEGRRWRVIDGPWVLLETWPMKRLRFVTRPFASSFPATIQKVLRGKAYKEFRIVNVSPHHMECVVSTRRKQRSIDLDPAERVMKILGEFSAGDITLKMSVSRWKDKQFPTSSEISSQKTLWNSFTSSHD